MLNHRGRRTFRDAPSRPAAPRPANPGNRTFGPKHSPCLHCRDWQREAKETTMQLTTRQMTRNYAHQKLSGVGPVRAEALESRRLFAGTPTVGVIGDSYSDEYQFYTPDRSTAANYVEQLAQD